MKNKPQKIHKKRINSTPRQNYQPESGKEGNRKTNTWSRRKKPQKAFSIESKEKMLIRSIGSISTKLIVKGKTRH